MKFINALSDVLYIIIVCICINFLIIIICIYIKCLIVDSYQCTKWCSIYIIIVCICIKFLIIITYIIIKCLIICIYQCTKGCSIYIIFVRTCINFLIKFNKFKWSKFYILDWNSIRNCCNNSTLGTVGSCDIEYATTALSAVQTETLANTTAITSLQSQLIRLWFI